MAKRSILISQEQIESAVVVLRGEKVLLDADLAALYGVTTRALNQAVNRNRNRFPEDFAFRLTLQEFRTLRSQIVISKTEARGGRQYAPHAFTEQGVAMLSSVLRSDRAARVNVEIMRAFVRLRRVLAVNAELAARFNEVEQRLGAHDEQFVQVIRAIRQLMAPPPVPKRRRIGFQAAGDESPADSSPSGSGLARRRRAVRKRPI